MKLFKHQEETAQFIVDNDRVFNTSDPGTGKTVATLEGIYRKQEKAGTRSKILVLAPLSILQAAWGNDIEKFFEGRFTYAIAHGTPKKRVAAFKSDADIIITNHDAVKWIVKDDRLLDGFDYLVVDESTAFKNKDTQRSRFLINIARMFSNRILLTGTPNSNTVLDVWNQINILDGSKRLGNYYRFRAVTCNPVNQVGFTSWVDRKGATEYVATAIHDLSVRYKFEDCVDIPEHVKHTYTLPMPKFIADKYEELATGALVQDQDIVNPLHAGIRAKKLLQLLSGAVYGEEGVVVKVHTDRYELVMNLVAEREQCVVAFNYRHELNELKKLAEKYDISYGVINGEVSTDDRLKAVEDFQAGKLKVIFAHPQSASHGLTLTRGTSTIWCSPTYNAEHYEQFNRRIYRAGQTRKTETIRIAYKDSKEEDVYEKLDSKLFRMEDLLNIFKDITKGKAA